VIDEKVKNRFRVVIAKKDGTRIALLSWLTAQVGELTSCDLSKLHYTGKGWELEAEIRAYVMFDWMDGYPEPPREVQAYYVTFTHDLHAILFKLSWSRAQEI
jgi:hypothetical protein